MEKPREVVDRIRAKWLETHTVDLGPGITALTELLITELDRRYIHVLRTDQK